MYGYGQYIPLKTNEILKRVSEEQIFNILIREEILEDKKALYKAPYRNDEIAGCWFERHNGHLYFVDFANIGLQALGCFLFIQKSLNLTFEEVLEYINNYFSLGLAGSSNTVKKAALKVTNNSIESAKAAFKIRPITILPRAFEYRDRIFWEKYNISKKDLIADKVIPVSIYRSINKNEKAFSIAPFDICYAYTDFSDGRMKIYRPLTVNPLSKWFTNCLKDDVGFINNLPAKGELLIISKSYKDCRVLRNLGYTSIWFQNEGMLPNMEILKNLCIRFEEIIVWFDNDKAGIGNGLAVVEVLNNIVFGKARLVTLPPKLLAEGIKDPSDLVAAQGEQALEKFSQSKNIKK